MSASGRVAADVLAAGPFGQREFLVALAIGLLSTVGTAVALRRSGVRPIATRIRAPVGGLVVTAVALVSLAATRNVPGLLLASVTVLAAAGGLFGGRAPGAGTVAAIGGLILLALAAPVSGWPAVGIVCAAPVGAVAIADFDHAYPRLTPWLLAGTAAGMYATLPDTEQAMILLGAVAGLALLWWPIEAVRVGPIGAGPLAALVAWSAATGGSPREGSVIGGLACFGLLVVEPAARRALEVWSERRIEPAGAAHPLAAAAGLLALQAVVVVVSSRVAGLRETASEAAAIVAPTLGGAFAVVLAGYALTGRFAHAPSPAP